MATILRIRGTRSFTAPRTEPGPGKAYLDRLIKLIPAEVVALYLAGAGAIEKTFPHPEAKPVFTSSEQDFWLGWTAFCLIAVVVVRAWATSSKTEKVSPEWPAVFIAAASFLVWVYSLGDVFDSFGLEHPLVANLVVFGWTFLAPFLYREEPAPADSAGWTAGVAPQAAGPFGEAQAEQSVLDSAERLTNRRPGLGDPVSDYFDTENRVRRLLGRVQDYIDERYAIRVELADGSSAELQELQDGTFHGLSSWVLDQVRAV